jgi:hypothetical protein
MCSMEKADDRYFPEEAERRMKNAMRRTLSTLPQHKTVPITESNRDAEPPAKRERGRLMATPHTPHKAEPKRPRKKKAEGDAPSVSQFKGKHPIRR